jgi:hypothetical protein
MERQSKPSDRNYRRVEGPFPEAVPAEEKSVKFVEDSRRVDNPTYDPRVEASNKVQGERTSRRVI